MSRRGPSVTNFLAHGNTIPSPSSDSTTNNYPGDPADAFDFSEELARFTNADFTAAEAAEFDYAGMVDPSHIDFTLPLNEQNLDPAHHQQHQQHQQQHLAAPAEKRVKTETANGAVAKTAERGMRGAGERYGNFPFPSGNNGNPFDLSSFAGNNPGQPYYSAAGSQVQPSPTSPADYPGFPPPSSASSSASLALPGKRPATQPLTPAEAEGARVAAEEDKRRRNTAASARFRVKKKEREKALEKNAEELKKRAQELEGQVEQLKSENKWLKELIVGQRERIVDKEDEKDVTVPEGARILHGKKKGVGTTAAEGKDADE